MERPVEPGGPERPLASAPLGSEAALESSVAAVVPGFVLLDQELEVGDGRRVQILGADGDGRLVLLMLVPGTGHEALVRALDVLRFLGERRAALFELLASPKLRPELAPRLLLVAEDFEPAVVHRLGALAPNGVQLLELRRVRTRRGERVFLAQLGAPGTEPAAGGASVAALLAGLGETERERAEAVRRRLARLDEELAERAEPGRLVWSLAGRDLAVLDLEQAPVRGTATGAPARALAAPAEVERFLADVVQAYLGGAAPPRAPSTNGPPPARRRPAADELPPFEPPVARGEAAGERIAD